MILQPVTVDHSALRCPKISEATRKEFSRIVPTPKGPVDTDGDRAWHDRQDAAIVRKNRVGQALLKDYDTCSGAASQPETPS